LACTLVYPNLVDGDEKARVQYIGKLLTADIQQVQETAVADRANASIVLAGNGYQYDLGEHQITRAFPEHGFTFKIIVASTDGEALATMDNQDRLEFNTDGSCNEINLQWQSNHFRGSLQVAADGIVSWKYEKRKK
jgi:hypothetical protein